MKNTGITRKVDELGRIVIPVELREKLNIQERSELEVWIDGEDIILRQYKDSCFLCGKTENLIKFKNRLICKKYLEEIKKLP